MNACKSLNARPAKAIEREASNNETTTEAFNYLAKTLAKVDVNKFSGNPDEDVDDWVFRLERHFKKIGLDDDEKIDFAVDYLRGSAMTAYRSMENWSLSSWQNFKTTLLSMYQPQNLQIILRMKLKKLQQTGSVQVYINDFNKLLYPIKNMSEEDKIIMFIDGLREATKSRVSYDEPSTLGKAKELAIRFETYYGNEWKGNTSLDNDSNRKQSRHQNGERNNPSPEGGLKASFNHGPESGLKASKFPAQNLVAQNHRQPIHGTDYAYPNYDQSANHTWPSRPHQGATHPNAAARNMQENFHSASSDARLATGSRSDGDRNTSSSGCFKCRRTGHIARNCPLRDGGHQVNMVWVEEECEFHDAEIRDENQDAGFSVASQKAADHDCLRKNAVGGESAYGDKSARVFSFASGETLGPSFGVNAVGRIAFSGRNCPQDAEKVEHQGADCLFAGFGRNSVLTTPKEVVGELTKIKLQDPVAHGLAFQKQVELVEGVEVAIQAEKPGEKMLKAFEPNNKSFPSRVKGKINGIEFDCEISTELKNSVLSESTVQKYKLKCKREQAAFRLADGSLKHVRFTEPLAVSIQGRECSLSFAVLPNKGPNALIGLDWFEHHSLETTKRFEHAEISEAAKLLPNRISLEKNGKKNRKADSFDASRLDLSQIAEQPSVKENKIVLNSDSALLKMSGSIAGIEFDCVLDTGATVSVISEKVAKQNKIKCKREQATIRLANGSLTYAKFTEPLPVVIQGRYCMLSFVVMPNEGIDVIIGLDWLEHHNIETMSLQHGILKFPPEQMFVSSNAEEENIDGDIAFLIEEIEEELEDHADWLDHDYEANLPVNGQPEEVKKLKWLLEHHQNSFAKNFMELGVCNVGHHVIKTTTETPIFLYPYQKSQTERQAIREEVEKLLKAGLVRPSRSPWAFPVVMIPKKDGSLRFCVDFRKLNAITEQDAFPMPRQDDLFDQLAGSVYFSCIDLKQGYMQLPLSEESIKKAAFTTPDGHYEFTRLPFGLKNAPAEFSRIMNSVLGDLSFVKLYIDDIIIHSRDIEMHLKHIEIVLNRLREANLKLNPSKCVWLEKEVRILGHIVSANKVEMDVEKITAIKNMKYCRCVKQVQQFLGLCGYYRRFVKDFAKTAAPLYHLLKKESKWAFDRECEEAFDMLKESLVSDPILRMPGFKRPFLLFTDASGFALGAILSQKDDEGNEYVCQYASRLLKGAEYHYGITEKECLAVLWAIKHFRVYLHGTKFTVITDHSALVWLMSVADPTGRLARWSLYLQAYQFDIVHRKGRVHSNVDALSRPVLACELIGKVTGEEEKSSKILDPFEDEALLYYLRHGKNKAGIGKNQARRVLKESERYELVEGRLFFIENRDKKTRKLIVPPPEERTRIAVNAHLLGHFQEKSTGERIRERFFWPKMSNEVRRVIANCHECIRHEKSHVIEHPAQALEVLGVMDRVSIDYVFGLPETDEGFTGIAVITEYLTKFVWAVPVRSKSMEEAAEVYFNFVSIFGPSRVLLSDQGKEFCNSLLNHLTKKIGVEHRVTSPYHPRTNGHVERFNQTLINALKKHTEKEPSEWHKWLPYVLLAYRSRKHSSTGFTPYELMFGRSMLHFEDYSSEENDVVDETAALINRANEIKNLVENTHPEVVDRIREGQIKQKRDQDRAHRVSEALLPVGTKVTIRVLKLKSKLLPTYHGIFTVVGSTPKNNYWLQNERGDRLTESYPRSRLKVVNLEEEVTQEEDPDAHVEVEKILDHRMRKGRIEYFVKWANQDDEENSWEPEAHFDTTECIEDYWNSLATPIVPNQEGVRRSERLAANKSSTNQVGCALISVDKESDCLARKMCQIRTLN